MGVSTTPDRLGAPVPPGASQDALLRRAADELQDKPEPEEHEGRHLDNLPEDEDREQRQDP